jgi:Mg-chelatase subunit ChlD
MIMRPAIVTVGAACAGLIFFLVCHHVARPESTPPVPVPFSRAMQPEPPSRDDATALALILDTSGSMDETVGGGETKLQCAKHVLGEDFLPLLAEDVHVALYCFQGQGALELAPLRRNGSADAPGWTHREIIMEQVDQTAACGGTPIAASLRQASGALQSVRGRRIIVLVTDGEESYETKQDVLNEVRRIRSASIETFVVGFNVGAEGTYLKQELGLGRAYFEANGGRAALLEAMNGIMARIEK